MTFGAGGYTRALLDAGADRVYGVDRDPMVFDMAQSWAADYGDRLHLVEGVFSKLDEYASDLMALFWTCVVNAVGSGGPWVFLYQRRPA